MCQVLLRDKYDEDRELLTHLARWKPLVNMVISSANSGSENLIAVDWREIRMKESRVGRYRHLSWVLEFGVNMTEMGLCN